MPELTPTQIADLVASRHRSEAKAYLVANLGKPLTEEMADTIDTLSTIKSTEIRMLCKALHILGGT